VAVGHSILVIIHHLLSGACDYRDLGGDFFAKRDVERQKDRLIGQLQDMGYKVTVAPGAAA